MSETRAMKYALENRLNELLPSDLHDPTLTDDEGCTVAMYAMRY